jgi:putative AbiEi antitoxin of type IV toxin-antitoxin system
MGYKERPHGALAELATRQHGVVSIRQLETLGYSRSSVAKATTAGRLHRLHRGVYALGHTRLSWHGRCLAVVLACAPALASHTSAGWVWGLLRSRPGTFHVTAPTRRHAKPFAHLHHAQLVADDCAVREGIPVTSLPRTLLDLAAMLPVDRLRRVIERSEELHLFDLDSLEACLDRAGGHPGAGPMRRALALYRAPAFTRSGLERRFLELVQQAGLPTPSMNCFEAGHELDAYWRPERFVVELDVYETHGSREAFERDRLRQEELKLLGIEMVRVTGCRLDREPGKVLDRVGALLEQRRGELRRSAGSGLDQASGERAVN